MPEARGDAGPCLGGPWKGSGPSGRADIERAHLDMVFGTLDLEPPRPARKPRQSRLFGIALRSVCRRGLPGQASPRAIQASARRTVLQPLWTDRDQRLHLL